MITWLGQAQQNPEDAAGKAAKEEILKTDWPPKREDTERIGEAAGGAAGTATCLALAAETGGLTAIAAATGICSDLGEAIGEFIGGAIYDIVDGFFRDEEYVAPQFDFVIYNRTQGSVGRLVKLKADKLGPQANYAASVAAEYEALVRWGMPPIQDPRITAIPRAATGADPTPYYSREGLENYLRLLAAAESARGAEIIALSAMVSQRWGALAKISAHCRQDQACVDRTIVDMDAVCQKQGNVPDTPAYVDCVVFLAALLPSAPAKSSSGALPVVIGAAAIAGVAWWLLA
jgi:hypothetical protein